MDQTLTSQETAHTSPFMGDLCDVYCSYQRECPGGGGGGVLGQVSDRDAPHRPSTRNATRVKKGGSKLYILPNFDEK